ncbi:MAG: ParA family protein [Desulforegulaceae bacterium]|nr:ParA family protein [Desulforegulaceae bacterium]
MSKIISIINHNSKSGKTIISFNLSCALSLVGKKTLYLTYKSNFEFEKLTKNRIVKKLKFEKLEKFSCSGFETILPDLDVLVLDNSFYDVEEDKDSVFFLKKYLKFNYNYIICDSQSTLLSSFDFFTAISDEYIIPIETDPSSFDSLAPMFAKIEWIKEENNGKPVFSGFLLNKVFKDSKLSDLFKKHAFFLFQRHVLDCVIPFSDLINLKINPSGCILDDVMDKSFVCFIDLAKLIIKGENS